MSGGIFCSTHLFWRGLSTMINPLKLRTILLGLGVDQRQYAQICGLTKEHINRLLPGKVTSPGQDTREKLAHGLRRLITTDNILIICNPRPLWSDSGGQAGGPTTVCLAHR